MRIWTRIRSPTYAVPRPAVVLAAGLIVAVDAVIPEAGESIWLVGALDEVAHLATGMVTLGALGPVVNGHLARGLVGSSALLDIDHVPQYSGARWLTADTERPYPHSLLTLIAAWGAYWGLRRRAPQCGATATARGALIGLAAHFMRDLAEPDTGMPLLWPIDNRAFRVPRRMYRTALAVGVARRLVGFRSLAQDSEPPK